MKRDLTQSTAELCLQKNSDKHEATVTRAGWAGEEEVEEVSPDQITSFKVQSCICTKEPAQL